jgi:membrane-bound metal-dependent hydrolase YbcI (DUF457 family)
VFVGHYGPSFAAKALNKSIPLWVLFIAVQLVDVLWGIFVLVGIEKVRIVPGITATNPLDLFYMPYTHSLIAAFVWSSLALIGYRFIRRSSTWGAATLVSVAVFSHWILDLVVHRPDLPIYDNTAKVGLGLWNYPGIAFLLEAGLLFGGILIYLRTNAPSAQWRRYATLLFGIVMLAIQAYIFFGPPPASDKAAAVLALISYFLFALVAYWLESNRATAEVSAGGSG